MGKLTKPQETKQATTQQQQTHGSQQQQGKQSGTSFGGGFKQNTGQKQGVNINQSVGGQNTVGGGTQQKTGQNVTTGTGTTTGTTNQTGTGKTGYDFKWIDRPETADVTALRNYKGGIDPTIPYQAAAAKEDLKRFGGAIYGSGAPQTLAEAQQRQGGQEIDQQMAQAYQQDAFRRGQEELGKLTNLAGMTQPIREMVGQTSEQSQTGTSGQTTQNQQVQDLNEAIKSENWQDAQNYANSMGVDLQSYIDEGMEANYGETSGDYESSGTQDQSMTGSGTQTMTQPSQFWGNMLGAGASIGGAALM
jgi:hypothetical protein